MKRTTLKLGLSISFLLALAFVPLQAQRSEPLPEDLQDIGVTQNLEAQVPLDLEFVDELGRTVRLADYFADGRPVLLSLVYYECPMLCTLVLDGMVQVLNEMEWTPGREFDIVTVSIDPEETPELATEKKNNYLQSYGRPEAADGWHFLTGDEQQIRQLADVVGFRYSFLPEQNEYAHPAVLFVLTPEGKVSRYLFGVQHQSRTLRLSLVEASQGVIGNPVDKFLLYCYRYNAQEGRYAPVAMKIMRLGGGLTVLVFGGLLLTFWLRDARQKRKRLA